MPESQSPTPEGAEKWEAPKDEAPGSNENNENTAQLDKIIEHGQQAILKIGQKQKENEGNPRRLAQYEKMFHEIMDGVTVLQSISEANPDITDPMDVLDKIESMIDKTDESEKQEWGKLENARTFYTQQLNMVNTPEENRFY